MDASFKKKAQYLWTFKVEQGEQYPVDYDDLHERRRAFKEGLDAIR